jgi:plasmid stability protein
MADVKIRRIPDWVVLHHQARARQAGRSLEEELRLLLTEDDALRPQREFAERARALRQRIFDRYGVLSDSTALIREDRDSRG